MGFEELTAIMARLRDPTQGCPWDLEQSYATIAPYTIEEAYEVADAIERHDREDLKDELGDLLFQVVFHAQLAKEEGAFDIGDIIAGICAKMRRRHPHVFGDTRIGSAAEQSVAWEEHKARERPAGASELDGIPRNLPALTRAVKLGRRASRIGFDWASAADALGKIDEEVAELRHALAGEPDPARVEQEIGDLLFSVTNVCRHLGADPERALRGTNMRFEARFRHIEAAVAASGRSMSELTLAELDRLWDAAKDAEETSAQGPAFSTHSSPRD